MASALAYGVVHMNCILYFMLVFSCECASSSCYFVRYVSTEHKKEMYEFMYGMWMLWRSQRAQWMEWMNYGHRWRRKDEKGCACEIWCMNLCDARVKKKKKMKNKRSVNFQPDSSPVFARPRIDSFFVEWVARCMHQMYFISENLVH